MYHRLLQTKPFRINHAVRFLSSTSTSSSLAAAATHQRQRYRRTQPLIPLHNRHAATVSLRRFTVPHPTGTATSDPIAQQTPTSAPTPTTFAQYLDLLRTDVNKMRRVHGATLTAALEHARFSAAGTMCTVSDTLFLLQCCSMLPEKPRPEKLALIELAWSLVLRHAPSQTAADGGSSSASATGEKDTQPQPTAEQLIALLREYRTNMKKLNHGEFIERYAATIQAAGPRVYEALLYVAAEVGDEMAMVRSLQAIRNLPGVVPSADVFNALILGHSRCHQLAKCEQVVDAMLTADVQPTARTYKELIRAYIENGEPERAEALLAERGADLSVPQVFSVIRTAIRRDDQSRVLQMAFERLPAEIRDNRHIIPEIRNACVELIQANEARKAFRIIEQLPLPKFSANEDSDGFASFFVSELIRSGTAADDVTEMARKLVDSGRNVRALHVCCEVALRHGGDDALRYLQELARLEALRPHYFWPLLVRETMQNGETGCLNVLREMAALEVTLDYDTLAQYVLPRLTITLAAPILGGCKELEDRGIKMSVLMAPLLGHLVQQNRLLDGVEVVAAYASSVNGQTLLWPLVNYVRNVRHHGVEEFAGVARFLQAVAQKNSADTDLTGQLVLELISNPLKRMPYEVLVRLLQQFRAHGVKMSRFSGDVVGQYAIKCADAEQRGKLDELLKGICDKRLNTQRLDAQSEHIKHPRDMSLEELECHLVELQSKGANTRGVLRRLLQQNVRAGNLERAQAVHAECIAQSVSLSAGMVSAILDLMVRIGNLSGAEAALRQLNELFPAFVVDEHKILDLATLLVQHQKVQTAKAILHRRATASDSTPLKGGAGIQKNVWHLLNNVASLSADPATPLQAKPMFEFLHDLGYCEPLNNVLGPTVRECLNKGMLKRAVEEFEDAARIYRCTPLQFELLTQLIAATNGTASAANVWPQPLTIDEAKELLQQVIAASTRCHGSVRTNVSLVVAFAHSGTDAQVRKILIDPAVRVTMPAILKQCEYLCESGETVALERLAKCSRGLGGDIRETDFYALMMAQFVRQNDVEGAMGLFERLVADDEFKVTAELTRTLMGLLERNHLEVPSSVLMYVRGPV